MSRIEHDGSTTILASHVDGKRLNSPNDVVVKSDDSVWFSDPTYGIDSEYEGGAARLGDGRQPRLPHRPARRARARRGDGLPQAERPLLLARRAPRSTSPTPAPPTARTARATSACSASGRTATRLDGGRSSRAWTTGLFDGFRCDGAGNVWTSAHDGVQCYAPDGTLLGKVRVPEVVANLCFGGRKRNRLYICGTTSLYAIFVNAQGATWPNA